MIQKITALLVFFFLFDPNRTFDAIRVQHSIPSIRATLEVAGIILPGGGHEHSCTFVFFTRLREEFGRGNWSTYVYIYISFFLAAVVDNKRRESTSGRR